MMLCYYFLGVFFSSFEVYKLLKCIEKNCHCVISAVCFFNDAPAEWEHCWSVLEIMFAQLNILFPFYKYAVFTLRCLDRKQGKLFMAVMNSYPNIILCCLLIFIHV